MRGYVREVSAAHNNLLSNDINTSKVQTAFEHGPTAGPNPNPPLPFPNFKHIPCFHWTPFYCCSNIIVGLVNVNVRSGSFNSNFSRYINGKRNISAINIYHACDK